MNHRHYVAAVGLLVGQACPQMTGPDAVAERLAKVAADLAPPALWGVHDE